MSHDTPSEGQLVEALRPAVSKIFDHFDELSRGQALQILVDAMRDLEPSSERGLRADAASHGLLPDCMMPDGAEPCAAYQHLERELATRSATDAPVGSIEELGERLLEWRARAMKAESALRSAIEPTKHDWQPDDGVLKFESHPGTEAPHVHATCTKCKGRAWFTELQWEMLSKGCSVPTDGKGQP